MGGFHKYIHLIVPGFFRRCSIITHVDHRDPPPSSANIRRSPVMNPREVFQWKEEEERELLDPKFRSEEPIQKPKQRQGSESGEPSHRRLVRLRMVKH